MSKLISKEMNILMLKEIKHVYLLILSLDIKDFQKKYDDWPEGEAEVWAKGKVIDYGNVRKFLNGAQ